jgi:hypothetical protein
MLSVKVRRNQWATAKSLRASATQLYDTLARAMAKLVFLLNGSMSHAPRWSQRAKRILRRLGKSADTAHSIDAILAEVQNQADLFDRCLDHVRDQRAIDTGADVAANKAISERNEARLISLVQTTEERHVEVMESIKGHESGPAILNILHQTITYVQPREDPVYNPASQPSPGLEPLLNEIELHDILSVSPRHPANDLELILKELSYFNISAQTQAQQLFASHAFISWMASTEPATILVHGNFAASGSGRITALSVLCAMFALQLRRSNNAEDRNFIVLHHFCGLHGSRLNALDSLPGPNGLIRSLLAQLLQTGRHFNLDFINTRSFVHDLENQDLQMLCSTFFQLIAQLPRKITVVCILDGLSEFTSQQFAEELVDVLHIMDRLVTHQALRPNFKLLGTTPLSRDGLLDYRLTVKYPLELQIHGEVDEYGAALSERGFNHLVSEGDRYDYYQMQMRMNRAAEREKYDSESEDGSNWDEL